MGGVIVDQYGRPMTESMWSLFSGDRLTVKMWVRELFKEIKNRPVILYNAKGEQQWVM